MADDGMLVNFSFDGDTLAPQTKFKGGSWKDRFLVKKASRARALKKSSGTANPQKPAYYANSNHIPIREPSDEEFAISRPVKRRREESDFTRASTQASKNNSANEEGNGGRYQTRHNGSRSGGVISSLFSYNPEPTFAVKDAATPVEELPAKPSNAPLVDGIDNFTTLGLSPALATHLLTKMNLKNPTAIQRSSVSQLVKEDSDAFIQSETGSGKTLAYLLPIVQRIMTISEQGSPVHRDSGLFAIVLAPTRELCKQISVVLDRLLGCAHWIVGGTVIGGEGKKSEKARLRKGVNILVATPGRLVDHLDNTKALDVSKVRWLVLDEGDRLMDLGFDEDISKIVRFLDQRQKKGTTPGLPEKRTSVLCSATMKMTVQRLGEISLKDAVLIKSEGLDGEAEGNSDRSSFLAPAQLKQSYVVVPAKLRLVTLASLLKRTFARKGSVMKAIVFISCADSVEFHFKTLTRENEKPSDQDEADESSSDERGASKSASSKSDQDSIKISPLLSTSTNTEPLNIFKLHGSLPQPVRTSIVKAFSTAITPSLLIATDVASRGLDLPNLDLVIEYDPPFSSDDHLHRIGRTARLGRDGRAIIFLMPGAEEGYVDVLKSSYKTPGEGGGKVTQMDCNEVLKKGFVSPSGTVASKNKRLEQSDWEQQATNLQLNVERWVLAAPQRQEMARKAFQSHIRAYATHVAAERKWFDIKELHLGHLAKAFGLREAPGRMNVHGMGGRGSSGGKNNRRRRPASGDGDAGKGKSDERAVRNETTAESEEAARKMKEKVRNKRMMMGGGADEFNIA